MIRVLFLYVMPLLSCYISTLSFAFYFPNFRFYFSMKNYFTLQFHMLTVFMKGWFAPKNTSLSGNGVFRGSHHLGLLQVQPKHATPCTPMNKIVIAVMSRKDPILPILLAEMSHNLVWIERFLMKCCQCLLRFFDQRIMWLGKSCDTWPQIWQLFHFRLEGVSALTIEIILFCQLLGRWSHFVP